MWNYLDESGEFDETVLPKRLPRLTLGRFFAPEESAKALREEWREPLEVECLSEFHLKEIASDEYRYSDWPPER
jgi:hypothetical protein